tara:strand:- start:100 stop:255 length:156 start_codon:yes stop_codon:yes gene_type:complete
MLDKAPLGRPSHIGNDNGKQLMIKGEAAAVMSRGQTPELRRQPSVLRKDLG